MSKHLTEALNQAKDNLALFSKALEQSKQALDISMKQAHEQAETPQDKQALQMAELQIKNLVKKAQKGENVTKDIERISKQYKQK